jgi:hypothetical protein
MEELKFSDWIELISEPGRYMDYGKFKIYNNIIAMWSDYPQTFVIGAGPGNFMSRANYTFTNELLAQGKGVAVILENMFNIKYPRYGDLHSKYILNSIKTESVFGTWQLSSPYTSYLAAISEIGIFGGVAVVVLYFFLILKSFKYIKDLKKSNPVYIPLGIALIGGTTYLFGLAFLDNYWEMARVTLPVWLLFWTVKTIVYSYKNEHPSGFYIEDSSSKKN